MVPGLCRPDTTFKRVLKRTTALLAPSAAHRPGTDALGPQDVVGHPDLLLATGVLRHAGAAVGAPGAHGELQATVEAVAGAGRPVAARLAGGDGIPVHAVRIRGTGRQPHGCQGERTGE